MAKGIDQKSPPTIPKATTVSKVIGSRFGIPKRGPNNGITDVRHPIGMRILMLTSGHSARFDIRLTVNPESTDNKNQPPHNISSDSGSSSGRMNTARINIASIPPVAAPEIMIFFQFIDSPTFCFLIIPKVDLIVQTVQLKGIYPQINQTETAIPIKVGTTAAKMKIMAALLLMGASSSSVNS